MALFISIGNSGYFIFSLSRLPDVRKHGSVSLACQPDAGCRGSCFALVTLLFHCHAYRMAGWRGSVSLSCLPDDRKTWLLLCSGYFTFSLPRLYRMAGRRGSVSLSCLPDDWKIWLLLCSGYFTFSLPRLPDGLKAWLCFIVMPTG